MIRVLVRLHKAPLCHRETFVPIFSKSYHASLLQYHHRDQSLSTTIHQHSFSKLLEQATLTRTSYPVGGVRIEDDILIVKDGYENLTTAPKGDEALKIINADDEAQSPWWMSLF